ncbi:MAG: DNA-processing protein DprA [Planctomycetaceae bacterium]|jgi:DNA processing protein|nr:DNA-processing protein DprA [Planctomycetaceae bacterium]
MTLESSKQTAAVYRQYAPDELIDELTLWMVSGVGSKLTQQLLRRFGDVRSVLAASVDELQTVSGIGSKLATNISQAAVTCNPEKLIEQCRDEKILILSINDSRYPEQLRSIDDPPPVLFVKGTLQPSDASAVAIVGTRNASDYGRSQTRRLAKNLAQSGFTIVSGLAYGIDGEAHRGALEVNGRTIAVFGNGLLHIFPPEHKELADEIANHGALVSEYAPSRTPDKGLFPQRNRIVSGLSLGVLVVEAPRESGALITATAATKQGRKIFAVPGQVDNEFSRGCHQLIRSGAVLVETVDDLLEQLGNAVRTVQTTNETETKVIIAAETIKPRENVTKLLTPAELKLNETETKILTQINTTPTLIDDIISETNLPPHQVLTTITMLEIRRIIKRAESNTVIRVR